MRILFVCIENAGRSQMAEGFAKTLAPSGMEISSAGSKPARQINPIAVQVMRERGIDISAQSPKGFEDLSSNLFDVVVGMGCQDACPSFTAQKHFFWEIPDPKNRPIETVRLIRNQIEAEVEKLFLELFDR